MSTSAPTVRAVVADSNTVVQGDWWMVGAPWRITCFRAQQGDVRLVVPEMVMMEVTGRFRAHASSELEKLKSGQRLLTRLGMEIDWPDLDVDVGEMADRYRASLEARVLGARGIIAQLPDVDLMRLVKKAIDRTPPFDSNGNGFRDALLWEHVLQQLDTAATVALISNDHRAFAASKDQPGVLSSGLTAEVAGRGFDEDAVRLYPDVAAFLRAAGTVDLEAFAAVADIIEEDRDQLAANLTIAIGRADISDRNGRAQVFLERSHEPASIDLPPTPLQDPKLTALEAKRITTALAVRASVERLMASDDGRTLVTLDDLLQRPEWHLRAECRGMGIEAFFPGRGSSTDAARAVCERCEARAECLCWALAESEREVLGVWGGATGRERRQMRRGAVA